MAQVDKHNCVRPSFGVVELWEHRAKDGKLIQSLWAAELPDGTIFAVAESYGKDLAQLAYETKVKQMVQ